MSKPTVCSYFLFYIEINEKCYVGSFVEQVKVYWLVHDLFWKIKYYDEKNHKHEHGYSFNFMENR
jgi:hypothetical protein